jgi:hypothetical protein
VNKRATKFTVRVFHSQFGCDTGCCGHYVEISDGDSARKTFEFAHPYSEGAEEQARWARMIAEETISKAWPECLKSIDWSSLNVSEVSDD